MAKLPTVVTNIAPDLRAFVNRVREAIEGKGGNKLVTVNDLIDGGIAVPGPGGTIIPPGGGVVGPPPAPTNVVATGAIQNIIVEWDDPRYYGHAHAEVWGSETDNIGTAVLLGMTPGSIYIDAVGPSVTRYYWVRFINILDTAGPYNAVGGTLGQTGPAVEYLLNTLTDAALDPAAPYSKFAVRADLFYVVPDVDFNQETTPTATAVGQLWYQPSADITRTWTGTTWGPFSQSLPFIVNSSPQTINGVSVPAGVFMDAAFIKNGTITNAKIGNAAIDDAKIANLSAGKITAGSLSVGSYIESSNYIAGSQGWKIDGGGTAEFGAASIRGQLTAAQIDSRGLSIRDAANNIILNAGTGAFLGNVTGTVNGVPATTVISELNTKLDSDARNVLAGSGGLAAGTLNWNTSGVRTSGSGVGLTANGLVAFNTSGAATFTLNASTGNATFAGTLSAASGTFAGSLTARTILADNIVANAIAVANQYYLSGSITAIATFGTTLTTSNTNIIGQFTVSNTSNVNTTLSAVGTGRSGATGASNNQYQAFSVFDSDGLTVFNYGWTEMLEDAKAFSFTFPLNANSSETFYVRGAKTNTPTQDYSLQVVVMGVKN